MGTSPLGTKKIREKKEPEAEGREEKKENKSQRQKEEKKKKDKTPTTKMLLKPSKTMSYVRRKNHA